MEQCSFSDSLVEILGHNAQDVCDWIEGNLTEFPIGDKYPALRLNLANLLTEFLRTKFSFLECESSLASTKEKSHNVAVRSSGNPVKSDRSSYSARSSRSISITTNVSALHGSPACVGRHKSQKPHHVISTRPQLTTLQRSVPDRAGPTSKVHEASAGDSLISGGNPVFTSDTSACGMDVQLSDLITSGSRSSKRRLKRLESRLAPCETNVSFGFGSTSKLTSRFTSDSKTGEGLVKNAASVTGVESSSGESQERRVVSASPQLVCGGRTLDALIQLYTSLLLRHHILGLGNQLVFLVRLLTGETTNPLDVQGAVIPGSLHNAVYFSVQSLWYLRHQLITLFDSPALLLLAGNARLRLFNMKLSRFITAAAANIDRIQRQESVSMSREKAPNDGREHGSFSFTCDAVSRPNFVDDHSFNAFRRQRDLLHEIVSGGVGSVFDGSGDHQWRQYLCERGAEQLFDACRSPVNMYHLARLFVALLLQYAPQRAAPPSDPTVNRLTDLSDMFVGVEKMFRTLLVDFSCAEFRNVIRDVLIGELFKMDQASSSELTNSWEQHEYDFAHIERTCLLAKYLSVVVCAGCLSRDIVPETVSTTLVATRNLLPPPLDLQSCLERAVREGHLFTSLPWIMQYLIMLDGISILTLHHQSVLRFALVVRTELLLLKLECARHPSEDSISDHEAASTCDHKIGHSCVSLSLLLRVLYERLFEIHWRVRQLMMVKCDLSELSALDSAASDDVLENEAVHMTSPLNHSGSHYCSAGGWLARLENAFRRLYLSSENASGGDLKSAPVLRASPAALMFRCCPQLQRVADLLHCFNSGGSFPASPSVRRPIVAIKTHDNTNTVNVTQCGLERVFYHSHSQSVRKTIEFVTDRLSSALVKHSRDVLIPHTLSSFLRPAFNQSNVHNNKNCRLKLMEEMVNSHHGDIIRQLLHHTAEQLDSLVSPVLDSLLFAEPLTASARDVCRRLVVVTVQNKLTAWLHECITTDFLSRIMLSQCDQDRQTQNMTDSACSTKQAPSLTDLIIVIKRVLTVLESGEASEVDGRMLSEVTEVILQACTHWNSQLPDAVTAVLNMSYQLALDLVCFRPDLFTERHQLCLLNFWTDAMHECCNVACNDSSSSSSSSVVRVLLSPSSMWLLCNCSSGSSSWFSLSRLLVALIQPLPSALGACTEACIVLMKHEWSQVFLNELAVCLEAVHHSCPVKSDDHHSHENQQWLLSLTSLMKQCDIMEDVM